MVLRPPGGGKGEGQSPALAWIMKLKRTTIKGKKGVGVERQDE